MTIAAPELASRLLAGWHATGTAADLPTHLARYGPLPDHRGLIGSATAAGLRGRGGGGFPTGRKLQAVADARGRRTPVVLANGCEGEPASGKDAALLSLAPHLVIDGAVLAARALGAAEIVFCVHGAGASLTRALSERDDGMRVRVVTVPDRYVASEESALVRYVDGGPALPTTTPPRPAERGVGGAPTLVDNVETLAHLALIARYGAGWFRRVGTDAMPGTVLLTVGGAVTRPGVYETPAGTPLGSALDLAGGPVQPVGAVLTGGYGGTWVPVPHALGLPLDHESCRAADATLGAGVLLALPAAACGPAQTLHLLRHLVRESAGQCGPCVFGLPAVTGDLAEIVAGGSGAAVAHARLTRRLGVIAGRGACAHPDGAVRLTASALRVFADDLAAHVHGRPCPAAGAPALFPGVPL